MEFEFVKAAEACIKQCINEGSGEVRVVGDRGERHVWLSAEWDTFYQGNTLYEGVYLSMHYLDTGRVVYTTLIRETVREKK